MSFEVDDFLDDHESEIEVVNNGWVPERFTDHLAEKYSSDLLDAAAMVTAKTSVLPTDESSAESETKSTKTDQAKGDLRLHQSENRPSVQQQSDGEDENNDDRDYQNLDGEWLTLRRCCDDYKEFNKSLLNQWSKNSCTHLGGDKLRRKRVDDIGLVYCYGDLVKIDTKMNASGH